MLHADQGQADKLARPDVQVLIGSVKLRHDSMYMYCDSALIYEKTNLSKHSVMYVWSRGIPFSSMVIILFIDGMTQIAQLREKCKNDQPEYYLLTDSLNYDRLYNLGYYLMEAP